MHGAGGPTVVTTNGPGGTVYAAMLGSGERIQHEPSMA